MREIKFRAKSMEGGWVYGFYNERPAKDMYWMTVEHEVNGSLALSVDSNTVGQFTGLSDQNGKDIYEGDIINWYHGLYDDARASRGCSVVEWSQEYTGFEEHEQNGRDVGFPLGSLSGVEVIGNIYESPELLKVEPKHYES